MKIALTHKKNASTAKVSKNIITKHTSPKSVVAEKTAKAVKPKKWTRHTILNDLFTQGLDGAVGWLGEKIAPGACDKMFAQKETLLGGKLKKTDRVLVVLGKMLYAWPLLGLTDDTYERRHSPQLNVRGSLALLRQTYGSKNVRLLSVTEAQELMSKYNTERHSREALFPKKA